METPAAPTSPAASLLERLSQQLTTSATAQAVYGTPVERDGITVIPVAKAIYGFGGGGGSGTKEGKSTGGGLGAGAGVLLTPWATSSCARAAAASGLFSRRRCRWWR